MSEQWYVAKDGKRVGPLTTAKLVKLAAEGLVHPTDLLFKQGMSGWVPASSVTEVWQQGSTQSKTATPSRAPAEGSTGFRCRSCKSTFKVKSAHQGQKVVCPKCKQVSVAPPSHKEQVRSATPPPLPPLSPSLPPNAEDSSVDEKGGQESNSNSPSLIVKPLAWLHKQVRSDSQRAFLAGGGAALGLVFSFCLGCTGILSMMSGKSSTRHRFGEETRRSESDKGRSVEDDERSRKVYAQMLKVNAENARKIRRGMSESQVEVILGESYEKTNDLGVVGYTKSYPGLGQSQIIIHYTGGLVDKVNWIPPH